jgi:2-dehydro-3-deoxygluconokinase
MTRNILCFGEVLLRLSAPGKQLLLQGRTLETHVGGAEANVAVALSRFGHGVVMASTLPDNPLGHGCRDELRRHGVDTRAVGFGPGRMGMYFLTHGAGARAAEVLYDRADSAFALAPADGHDWPTLLAGVQWLHVSGITPAVSTNAAQAALAVMGAARALGVKVSFDCNFRAKLWAGRAHEAPALLRRLCEQADLIFGDDRDVALMLGFTSAAAPDERRRLAAQAAFEAFPRLQWLAGTERAVQGADVQQLIGTLSTRAQSWRSRAHALTGIVDRIGAGDAFAAGVLHGLITDMPPQSIVEFAAAAASLKHTIPGDFLLASVADVKQLLEASAADVRR